MPILSKQGRELVRVAVCLRLPIVPELLEPIELIREKYLQLAGSPQQQQQNYHLLIAANVCAVTALGLLIYWAKEYLIGFELDGSLETSCYHPVFMFVGLGLCYGNSAVIFRVLKPVDKLTVKALHTTVHVITIGSLAVGMYAVVKRNVEWSNTNMYSFHSWVGALTIILFLLQFILGFGSYLTTWCSDSFKVALMPVHRFLGSGIFIMGMVSIFTGMTEMSIYMEELTGSLYSTFPAYGTVSNLIQSFIAMFALSIMVILTNPSFRRKEIAKDKVSEREDGSISNGSNSIDKRQICAKL
ncbi:lysosomal membrane ascorbate-dependent ferrireductase CYB561A3-like [Convolutriloba macropyga]|uniref:lysosomal membrane ascorbate-dependent ferrireductase CYB561A3-like n=1 Tax=Convolutriloba macropyga TaxID=536237 RepID=UPI003F526138